MIRAQFSLSLALKSLLTIPKSMRMRSSVRNKSKLEKLKLKRKINNSKFKRSKALRRKVNKVLITIKESSNSKEDFKAEIMPKKSYSNNLLHMKIKPSSNLR